jgi:hypothetical protein
MINMLRKWPEIGFTAAMAALVAAISWVFQMPFNLPSGERAAFVGIAIALPCYAIILVCHFNLKLWAPHLNPMLWDDLYWQIDNALRPLVDLCFSLRRALVPFVPLDSNLYMISFITMFYISFCYHALRTPDHFRTLFIAALFLQGTGALAYLVMPALGPFLYQPGIETLQTDAQAAMLQAWHANMAHGTGWLARSGSAYITVGLAAMPSLHTGGSFLFLLFAWRHGRKLVPLYVLLFSYIAITAVASRWHYLIDLPVGMLLAWACLKVAERITRSQATVATTEPAPSIPEPVPAMALGIPATAD